MKAALTFFFLCFCATGLHAQALVLKDGTRIPGGQFTIANGKIQQNKTLSNGQTAQVQVAVENIDRLEWPEVNQILEAQTLMSEGKSKEAIETLQKAKDFFKPFKTVKGNPYNDVAFALVEVLDQAGDFDSLLRVLPEVEAMKWEGSKDFKLQIVKLNMDRRTSSDQDAILSRAQTLLRDTDDSSVAARLWMTIAEIHTRMERWEEAFEAYLHIPVFYGSQGTLVPQAELAAARTLVKMELFKDAVGFYQRIQEQYAGSEIAETAKKEMMPINGVPNKVDKIPGSKTKAKDKEESPKTAANPDSK
jgi:tetratricopeptide (TPR) repeat protein